MRTINGTGFTVSTPENWSNITDEVEADNPPFTLAAIDGYGALQFSVALFETGQLPTPSAQDLADMLSEFGKQHRLGRMNDNVTETEPLLLAATTFQTTKTVFEHGMSPTPRTSLSSPTLAKTNFPRKKLRFVNLLFAVSNSQKVDFGLFRVRLNTAHLHPSNGPRPERRAAARDFQQKAN